MKNSKFLMTLILSLMFVLGSQITTFAMVDETLEEINVDDLIENKVVEVEKVPLTPEGNLTLVDDVTSSDARPVNGVYEQGTSDETDKQFITAVSKNGNFFYLVIDRADNKDNVYLLNLVDEADLMALMEGEPVSIKETPQEIVTTPVVEEVVEIEEPVEEKKNSTLPALMTVIVLAGGGAFYYLKFVKGGIGSNGSSDLSEFDDDEDEYEDFDSESENDDEVEYEVEDDLIDKLEDYENDSL